MEDGLLGIAGCLKVPPLVSGSTGIGPPVGYYNERYVSEFKDMVKRDIPVEDCLIHVINKMEKEPA